MNELDLILGVWRASRQAPGVLATVVHVEGSAYRRPGARMLICPDGVRIGTISGGCLESDVARKAAWWTADGGAVLRTYDTRSDDDAIWEFGLGCNGVIHLLIEPLKSRDVQESLGFLHSCHSSRRPGVIATLIRANGTNRQIGKRLLFSLEEACGGSLLASEWTTQLTPHARAAFSERKSRLVHLPAADVFVEWIGPPQSLIVFGAGHDALPLAAIAQSLGWRITIADGRPAYADPARFPGATTALIPPSGDISRIEIHRDDAVVVMTHNYPQDKILLPQILECRPRYLGLLGPKTRTERLFEELGGRPNGVNLHYPVGLDIGAETPEAIALAIVAEIQAELAGRPGMPLKWRTDSIHTPAQVVGPEPSWKQETRVPAMCEIHA